MSGDDARALPLSLRPVARFDPAADDCSPGRRLRAFAALVQPTYVPFGLDQGCCWWRRENMEAPTYAELMKSVQYDPTFVTQFETFANVPLRIGSGPTVSQIPDETSPRDPELHAALQDLGNEINEDVREALDALDAPDMYYPGVDGGIEPVTDDHVNLVIWALQRELKRELRAANGQPGHPPLPAAPLSALPWNVQRALVERRRLRFRQWGIGREEWTQNVWSLWNVPEDADYVPRRAARLDARRLVA